MAKAQQLHIRESAKELKALMYRQRAAISRRIQLLITIKQQKEPLSKITLAKLLGVDPNSVQKWRTLYREKGIDGLLADNRGGKRREVINAKVHKAIEHRLHNPKDAFRSYTELCQWIEAYYIPGIKYVTLNAYVKRHFGAKLKTARKSHIAKDTEAIETFKKNA